MSESTEDTPEVPAKPVLGVDAIPLHPVTKQPILSPEQIDLGQELRDRNPKVTHPQSKDEVVVYNRSGGTLTHTPVDGPKIELLPGKSAKIPASLAKIWRAISNGRVVLEEEAMKAAKSQNEKLAAEQAKSAELMDKLAAAEKRLAELEAKLAPAPVSEPVVAPAEAEAAEDTKKGKKRP